MGFPLLLKIIMALERRADAYDTTFSSTLLVGASFTSVGFGLPRQEGTSSPCFPHSSEHLLLSGGGKGVFLFSQ